MNLELKKGGRIGPASNRVSEGVGSKQPLRVGDGEKNN